MRIAEVRARVALVRKALGFHPDVNAVGVGEKFSGGENLMRYAAVVFVERKGQPSGSPLKKVFETDRGPIETDIIEAPAQDFSVVNSLVDGADILVTEGPQPRRGTLSFVSQSDNGLFGITNAHVVVEPDGNAKGRSVLTVLDGVNTRIGFVVGDSPYRTDRLNTHDVALIRIDASAERILAPFKTEAFPDYCISKIRTLSATPQRASRRPSFYASKALEAFQKVQLGRITEFEKVNVSDGLTGQKLAFGRTFHLLVESGQVNQGHSGAALVRPIGSNTLEAVGILFAGSGNNAFALSWKDIAGALRDFGA